MQPFLPKPNHTHTLGAATAIISQWLASAETIEDLLNLYSLDFVTAHFVFERTSDPIAWQAQATHHYRNSRSVTTPADQLEHFMDFCYKVAVDHWRKKRIRSAAAVALSKTRMAVRLQLRGAGIELTEDEYLNLFET